MDHMHSSLVVVVVAVVKHVRDGTGGRHLVLVHNDGKCDDKDLNIHTHHYIHGTHMIHSWSESKSFHHNLHEQVLHVSQLSQLFLRQLIASADLLSQKCEHSHVLYQWCMIHLQIFIYNNKEIN